MLHHVINGEISEVYFNDTDDLVTVLCQSYGAELIQAIKGAKKPVRLDPDTRKICNEMLAQPELKHFGRLEPASGYQALKKETYGLLRDEWKLVRSPQDDNIFAPGNVGAFNLYRKSDNKFVIWRTTIWDVLKEMTLRHPGYVAYPMPYEGYWGPRMTLYFGLPSQMYFARDPQPGEEESVKKLNDFLKAIETDPKHINQFKNNALGNLKNAAKNLDTNDLSKLKDMTGPERQQYQLRARHVKKALKVFESNTALIKPFRSYHLLTSGSNIISNNIQASKDRSFNTVTLGYTDDGAGIFNLAGDEPQVNDATKRLESEDEDTFTMKFDDDLEDKDQVHVYAKYPNAFGEEQAKRYALSLLWNSIKKTYQGTIVVLGDAGIKPHSICYIADDYTNIYGQIEVEQVVHKFSAESGFITEITPLSVIEINETATMTVNEVMSMLAGEALAKVAGDEAANTFDRGIAFYKKIDYAADTVIDSTPGGKTISNLVSTPAKAIGGLLTVPLWAVRAWVTHSQYAHPFRFRPLVYRNEPMVRGLQHATHNKGFIYNLLGKWLPEGMQGLQHTIAKTYADYHPDNWLAPRGDFWSTFTGSDT
jgi:hypothetical protein